MGWLRNGLERLSNTCLLDGDKTLQRRTKKTDGALHLCVSSRRGWGEGKVSSAVSCQAEVTSTVLNRN